MALLGHRVCGSLIDLARLVSETGRSVFRGGPSARHPLCSGTRCFFDVSVSRAGGQLRDSARSPRVLVSVVSGLRLLQPSGTSCEPPLEFFDRVSLCAPPLSHLPGCVLRSRPAPCFCFDTVLPVLMTAGQFYQRGTFHSPECPPCLFGLAGPGVGGIAWAAPRLSGRSFVVLCV